MADFELINVEQQESQSGEIGCYYAAKSVGDMGCPADYCYSLDHGSCGGWLDLCVFDWC